jgi:protease IV
MSKFLKIMTVLAAIAAIGFLFLIAAIVGGISHMGQGGGLVKEKRPHLTVLHVEGPIMESDGWLESIRRISEDKACKGLLVRVDSPGGAVGASQEILSALKALRDKGLAVAVSQGNLAASGGYYISLAGERIFSNPGTLTGSIGVIMQFPEAGGLLDKVGIEVYTVKSGELKDVGNFARKPTPKDLEYLRAVIGDVYEQFLADILANRKVKREDLVKIADGRILTGREAKAHGLVDTLGGFLEAKAWLSAKVGLGDEPVLVREPPEKTWVENILESRFQGVLSRTAESLLPLSRGGAYFLWK